MAAEIVPSDSVEPVKLSSVADVRRALAGIFRDARAGRISAVDAGRLAYVAYTLGKLIELEQFEARLCTLERRYAIERTGDAVRPH